jgi:WD40 repeat protein
MDPLYDLHSWSKHYREETLREAQQRHLLQRKRADGQPISMRSTFRLATSAALMAVIVALLLALPGAKPAKAALAGFPEGQGPITFEKDGDVWVATRMGLANLTPNTATYSDVDPVVSPDGRRIAFASDRDGGDFEIYTANVFTGEVEQLTENTVYDYNPGWSFDAKITYVEPLLSPEDVRILGLRVTHEVPLSSIE